MIIGNPQELAIEYEITEVYPGLGQRALGFFALHIGGQSFGVREADATLLACSLDEVADRLAHRAQHRIDLLTDCDAFSIADAFYASRYDSDREHERFFGMTCAQLDELWFQNRIVWAPDGDEAFDDGSYVLQFDVADRVRLIAFNSAWTQEQLRSSTAEVWMNADRFYALLWQWQNAFESEWAARLRPS